MSSNNDSTRVVVTGMGAISPLGNSMPQMWDNLVAGRSGIDRITRFDTSDFQTKIAGEVKGFCSDDYLDRKSARRMDLFTQYAIAASEEAIRNSGLNIEKEAKDRIGVIVSSGIGGMTTFENQTRTLIERGPKRLSPFFIPMMISDIAPGYIAIRYGFKGPNFATVSACASGSHAIGEGFRTIQRKDAEVMICGSAEATVTPLGVGGFNAMKALSTRNDEPQKASRPFDLGRDGFVMGEGAGIVVLESLAHALDRGAHIHAEVSGIGYTADAYHITAPAPGGEGAVGAMQKAMRDADLAPEEIDYINAHGTSTPTGDLAETNAIKTVFGEHAHKLNINSTKSMLGHLLGASGGVEFITVAASIEQNCVHPTINQERADPQCDLNYTPNEAQKRTVNAAISNSFGFGGHNVSIAVRKFEE